MYITSSIQVFRCNEMNKLNFCTSLYNQDKNAFVILQITPRNPEIKTFLSYLIFCLNIVYIFTISLAIFINA